MDNQIYKYMKGATEVVHFSTTYRVSVPAVWKAGVSEDHLQGLWEQGMSMEVKRRLTNSILLPTLTWIKD